MSLKEDAAEKLQVAYADALSCESVPDCSHKDFIDFVIDNNRTSASETVCQEDCPGHEPQTCL